MDKLWKGLVMGMELGTKEVVLTEVSSFRRGGKRTSKLVESVFTKR